MVPSMLIAELQQHGRRPWHGFLCTHNRTSLAMPQVVSGTAPCIHSLNRTQDSFDRQETKDSVCSTMSPTLGSSACLLSAVEPPQHHDMACFILKGKRLVDDGGRGNLSPASNGEGIEQVCQGLGCRGCMLSLHKQQTRGSFSASAVCCQGLMV